MQTLLNKKKHLNTLNNVLFYTFFLNLFVVLFASFSTINIGIGTYLWVDVLNVLSIDELLILVCSLLGIDLGIIKKIDSNQKKIKEINKQLALLKEKPFSKDKTRDIIDNSYYTHDEIKNDFSVCNVKRKIYKK